MASTKMILGFIAGASLGAIAGILMAPDTGEATRKKIIDKSTDFKDLVKDSVLGFIDKLQQGMDRETETENLKAPRMSDDV